MIEKKLMINALRYQAMSIDTLIAAAIGVESKAAWRAKQVSIEKCIKHLENGYHVVRIVPDRKWEEWLEEGKKYIHEFEGITPR